MPITLNGSAKGTYPLGILHTSLKPELKSDWSVEHFPSSELHNRYHNWANIRDSWQQNISKYSLVSFFYRLKLLMNNLREFPIKSLVCISSSKQNEHSNSVLFIIVQMIIIVHFPGLVCQMQLIISRIVAMRISLLSFLCVCFFLEWSLHFV